MRVSSGGDGIGAAAKLPAASGAGAGGTYLPKEDPLGLWLGKRMNKTEVCFGGGRRGGGSMEHRTLGTEPHPQPPNPCQQVLAEPQLYPLPR